MNDSELELFTAALTKIKGIGNQKLKTIASKSDLVDLLTEKYFQIGNIKVSRNEVKLLAREIEREVGNFKVKILCYWSESYPEKLRRISDSPYVIYYTGDIDKLANNYFGVVGTRKPSSYGIRNTRTLVKEFTQTNWGIISGMAMGIDAIAQQEAVKNNIPTIAVLVGGPHKPTPAVNKTLYNSILSSGGLIISEQLPDSKVYPGMFASRNRIIAALSDGVLIIEGGKKSGSLITASLALDYGKEVFALPGNIENKNSEGTNYLIKTGQAKLVQSSLDIFEEFGIIPRENSTSGAVPNLTEIQKDVYDLLLKDSFHEEELASKLDVEIYRVLNACVALELKKLIYKDIVGKYNLI